MDRREQVSCDRKLVDRKLVSCDRKLVSCDRKLLSCNRKLVSCDRKLLSCDRKLVSCDRKLLRWLNRVMQDHEARASDLNRKLIFSFFLLFS